MSFFTQLKESVIDLKYALKIKDNKFGKTFTYLLLLFLIVYSMSGIKWYSDFSIINNVLTYGLSSKVPDFRLEKGEFIFDAPMPYEIANNQEGKLIIDTTGKTTMDDFKGISSGILITKDFVVVKSDMQERKIYFKDMSELKFNKNDILNIMPKLPGLLAVFLIFGFLFAFVWKLLNVLILAVIGILICKTQKQEIPFRQLFNIAAYSLTLSLLLQLAVTLSGIAIPYFGVLYWIISIMYVLYALRYLKTQMNNNDGNGAMLE